MKSKGSQSTKEGLQKPGFGGVNLVNLEIYSGEGLIVIGISIAPSISL